MTLIVVKWIVIALLLIVIGIAGPFVISMALTGGSTRSVGAGMIAIFGLAGIVASVIGGVGVYWLARSLGVTWPVYLIPVAFLAFHAFFGFIRLLDWLSRHT